MFRQKRASAQKGSSDIGIVMMVLIAAIIVSTTLGILGWVKSIKDARTVQTVHTEKPIQSPYHEPGAFQVTF